jgi:hypothetical protein
VGGNRTKNCEELIYCISSILHQNYAGKIEIILVVDPDNTQVKLLKSSFPKSVRFLDFIRPPDFVGRDAIARRKLGWEHASGQILAATGALIQWKSSNASIAVELMQTQGIEAVDGIVRRSPDDDSFIGLFRDEALITEFPTFREDFLLTPETMAESMRLPAFLTFFMTRGFFDRVKDALPISSNSDWDDFCIASAMVKAGGAIYNTNRLVAYLLHRPSLRMYKQFASGVSGINYCLDYPGRYARRRLTQTIMVITVLMLASLSTAVFTALYGLIGLGFCLLVLMNGFVLTGIINAITAKDWRAFFFPPLFSAQVFVWICGALYILLADTPDTEFLDVFRHKR